MLNDQRFHSVPQEREKDEKPSTALLREDEADDLEVEPSLSRVSRKDDLHLVSPIKRERKSSVYSELAEEEDKAQPQEILERKRRLAEAKSRERWTNSKYWFIISSAGIGSGLGALWRFPYLMALHGGGSFILPYLISLTLIGIPLLFFELALGAKLQMHVSLLFEHINPLFSGLGWLMLYASFLIVTYYGILTTWILKLLIFSIHPEPPPWKDNTRQWFKENITEEVDADINNTSRPILINALLLFVVWFLLFLYLRRNADRGLGPIRFILTTLPFLLVLGLTIKAMMLDGAVDGIIYFLIPNLQGFFHPRIWAEATGQLCFSLCLAYGVVIRYGVGSHTTARLIPIGPGEEVGGMMAFGMGGSTDSEQTEGETHTSASQVRWKGNVLRDTLWISLISTIASLGAGSIVFCYFGYLARSTAKTVEEVIVADPTLALVGYAGMIGEVGSPLFYGIAYFTALFLIGLDAMVTILNSIMSGLGDLQSSTDGLKSCRTLLVCILGCLFGFLYCVDTGVSFLALIDHYVCNYLLLLLGATEMICIAWYYGVERFVHDIRNMTGVVIRGYWVYLWKYITPIFLLATLVITIGADTFAPLPGGPKYPVWGRAIGNFLIWIPIIATLISAFRHHKQHAQMVRGLILRTGVQSSRQLSNVDLSPLELHTLHLEDNPMAPLTGRQASASDASALPDATKTPQHGPLNDNPFRIRSDSIDSNQSDLNLDRLDEQDKEFLDESFENFDHRDQRDLLHNNLPTNLTTTVIGSSGSNVKN